MNPEEIKKIVKDAVRSVIREELKESVDKIMKNTKKRIKCFNAFGNITETKWDDSISLSFDTIEHDANADLKVLVQIEPPEIKDTNDSIISHKDWFDLILTWNEDVLAACENAKKFIFGTCWINWETFKPDKKNEISYIMSTKRMSEGHNLRWEIWDKYSKLNNIKDFTFKRWLTPPRLENKNVLFENAKFHIVVENVSRNNWITEKVIDCFATKTIPIYWGCPNIGHLFNSRGILQFNTLEELEAILENITPELHDGMLDIIEENYQKSKKYYNVDDRLKDEINKKIKGIDE